MYGGFPVLMERWHEEWGCVIDEKQPVNVSLRVMEILTQFWAANVFLAKLATYAVFFLP